MATGKGKGQFGKVLTVLGAALLAAALALVLYGQWDESRATDDVADALTALESVMGEDWSEDAASGSGTTVYKIPASGNMSAVEVDGTLWLGALTIPSLGLELPVISTAEDLSTAPGRYSGSVWTDDLVLMGRNYSSHFGTLQYLSAGDSLTFTDVLGYTFHYQVTEIVEIYDLADVSVGDHDLVLLVSLIDGSGYLAVRCDRTTA